MHKRPYDLHRCWSVPSTADHVMWLSLHMRPEDISEVAAFGHTPLDSLSVALAETQCSTILSPRGILCMYGVSPWVHGGGRFWMLGSTLLRDYRIEFLRRGKSFVDSLKQAPPGFDWLGNIVDLRNTLHTQWLDWLGCHRGAIHLIGPQSLPFQEFYYV